MGMATFFAAVDEFEAWLERHGSAKTEFVVGYYKRGSNRPSMSWAESVDAALCHGWIDGVRKRIDEHSYQIRFTPRKSIGCEMMLRSSLCIVGGSMPMACNPSIG